MAGRIVGTRRGDVSIVILVMVDWVVLTLAGGRIVDVMVRAVVSAMTTLIEGAHVLHASSVRMTMCVMMKGLEGSMKRCTAGRRVSLLQPFDPQSTADSIAVLSHFLCF
jgi:hypothetical protein